MKLFLDDERDPVGSHWVVARNYEDFVLIVTSLWCPNHISFDHDLGENSLSGYDVTKWLVERDLDYNIIPDDFTFYVHSQNPVGAANISNLLNSYLKFKKYNT